MNQKLYLTRRENEILGELLAGSNLKQAARVVGVRPGTAARVMATARERLQAGTTVQLAAIALRAGLLVTEA